MNNPIPNYPDKHIVFYDGDCGFCNYWVQWILKRDHKDEFMFCALQSSFGQDFLKERGLENIDFDTIYLWKPNRYYLTKSEAIAKISKLLGGPFLWLSYLDILPRALSNKIYDKIAENRRSLMTETCLLPTSKERQKFIL